jgi:hypothetical protein
MNSRKSVLDRGETRKSQVASFGPGDTRRPSSVRTLHNRTPSFLKKLLAHKSSKLSGLTGANSIDGMINLPRGGVYVTSSAGSIQFGMPPETVKDSMELGMPVVRSLYMIAVSVCAYCYCLGSIP